MRCMHALGVPQKIRFLDCLFEEEVLRVKTAWGQYPTIESELLNHDIAHGIAYIISSFRNEVCIKSIFVMNRTTNVTARHHYFEEEFLKKFWWFKKRRDLGKSVLYTSGLATFLVLSSLSPTHVLKFFDQLDQRHKELFIQTQLLKIAYRYPDLINALPLQELIEKLPSDYGHRFEEAFKKIAFGHKKRA